MKKMLIKIAIMVLMLSSVVFAANTGVMYGDANGDQKVTTADTVLMLRYTMVPSRYPLNEKNADVNRDGVVNQQDISLVSYFLEGRIMQLPYKFLLGDVNGDHMVSNEDATLLLRYTMNSTRYPIIKENGDINKDGKIDSNDATLLKVLIAENRIKLSHSKDVFLGDANGDGLITFDDAVLILRHTMNAKRFPIVEKNCDVNQDNKITSKDALIVHAFVSRSITTLPFKGTLPKMGDVNGNGKITKADATLLLKHINAPSRYSVAKENCDVNLDGVVDSRDAVLIQKYVAGTITKLPYAE